MLDPITTKRTPQTRMLFAGRRGPDVAERQGLLNALADIGDPFGQTNLPELDPDGVYGSKTTMRVKEFQSRNRLHIDGVIGPKTDTRMDDLWIEYLNKNQPPAE